MPDDKGATGSSGIDIEILADPSNTIHVSQIQMTLQTRRIRKRANVSAVICDQDGIPVSGAQVTGSWSGLLSGEDSAVTADDGSSRFSSRWTKKSGLITFTVTGISLDGYLYAPEDNQASSGSIPTEEIVNQDPVSVVQATSDHGTGPLEVTSDGSGSYDSDGTIVAYHWDTGDGAVSDISLTKVERRSSSKAVAAVKIVDESGSPVPDVVVTARFSGLVTKDVSGVTGADGTVTLASRRTRGSGTIKFTLVDIARSGYVYSPQDNVVTDASIDIP